MPVAAPIAVMDDILLPRFLQKGGAAGALLRAMDWTRHPLGPPETWPVILQTTVGIVLGSRQPMFVAWGQDYLTIYNDGFAQICPDRHPASLGGKLEDMWYDIWDKVGPMCESVFAGESIHLDDFQVLLHRNGRLEEAHFSFSYTPLQNERAEVLGLFCACAETTEQVFLRRELDHERARLAQIFEHSRSFIAKTSGPDHVFELVNPAYMQLIGHRDIIGKSVCDALPEVASQGYIALRNEIFATGESKRIDGLKVALRRVPGSAAEDRYLDFVYQPVLNSADAVTGIFVEGVDVTDRTEALAALQTSEQFLQSILGASSDCIKVLDLDGRITYLNDGGRLVLELPEDEVMVGSLWTYFWQDEGHIEVRNALDLARNGVGAAFQGYANTFAGTRKYWDVRVTPMLDAEGRPERILAVSRDISYLKQIEEEREDLTRELSHRLKNAFGMVQSVINQTLRQAGTLDQGREVLSARVRALASAQDILTRSITSQMQIDEVVEAAILPHRTGEGRFAISGPVAMISGRQGLGLSLALHELATNATKFGALSAADGRVTITWDVQPEGRFSLHWLESNGPPVSPPARSGFGSVLIEKIVATYFDGSAELNFDPAGVAFHLSGTIAKPDAAPATDPY